MIAAPSALALIPDDLPAVDAAPLVCAGVTTFNALKHSGAQPGDLVAMLGLGGLGHLGVQFAAKMGFRTVAIARGADKAPLAKQARRSCVTSTARRRTSRRRCSSWAVRKVILATVTNGDAMTAALAGLGVNGTLLVLGAPHDPLQVPAGSANRRPPFGRGLVLGHLDRLAGHARLQRAHRRAVDDRGLSARTRRRGVREHDERRRPLSRGPEDGALEPVRRGPARRGSRSSGAARPRA